MKFIVKATLIFTLFLFLSRICLETPVNAEIIPTIEPKVSVYPARIVDLNLVPTKNFTVEVRIADVTDLKGFDIRLSWNASLLSYVSHVVRVPVEEYPGGVLHETVLEITNEANATSGTYLVAFTTLGGPSFTGSGAIFSINFTVMNYGRCVLDIFGSELSDSAGQPISHVAEDGFFSNVPMTHDVAVLSVIPCKTIVFKGYNLHVNVTLENQGTIIETFNVTLYANDIPIGKTTVYLNEGEALITFTWNTVDATEYETYTIRAAADQVSGETDTSDNSLSVEGIRVAHPGDFDADKDVDIFDIVSIAAVYGSEKGDGHYEANKDGDCDGDIDIFDVVRIAPFYGYKQI